jgi:hypothetical protein
MQKRGFSLIVLILVLALAAPPAFAAGDTTPPTITNVVKVPDVSAINFAACASGQKTITIRADIWDASGLAEKRLYYQEPGAAAFVSVPMTWKTFNTFEATIGPFANAGVLNYYVSARDRAGNQGQSEMQSLDVLTCDLTPPTIGAWEMGNLCLPFATMGVGLRPVSVVVTVTDESPLFAQEVASGVAEVRFYFGVGPGTGWFPLSADRAAPDEETPLIAGSLPDDVVVDDIGVDKALFISLFPEWDNAPMTPIGNNQYRLWLLSDPNHPSDSILAEWWMMLFSYISHHHSSGSMYFYFMAKDNAGNKITTETISAQGVLACLPR